MAPQGRGQLPIFMIVGEVMHPVYLFSNRRYAVEHVPNWNVRQSWKNLILLAFNLVKTVVAKCILVVTFTAFVWSDRQLPGTSEVHNMKILLLSTLSFKMPVTPTHGRVNGGSLPEWVLHTKSRCWMNHEKELKRFCAWRNNRHVRFRNLQDGWETTIHELHTYIIG
jgi:hypothetical protein